MRMLLPGKGGAGVDNKSLHLKAFITIDAIVATPIRHWKSGDISNYRYPAALIRK
jgi:hypothetical protein